jgi:hypothetical protein
MEMLELYRGKPHACDCGASVGKRFAIIMASNPCAESGEVFKISKFHVRKQPDSGLRMS